MFKNIIEQIVYLFGKEALKRKLAEYIYCKECGFTAPCEDFPFSEWDEDKERFCPNCVTMYELINASEVRLCNECGSEPASRGWNECFSCYTKEEERYFADQERRFENPDDYSNPEDFDGFR
ncbi:MAG: hypothetical protein Q8O83_00665 [bacterium]|nr:hypothetical protein [bacterium]